MDTNNNPSPAGSHDSWHRRLIEHRSALFAVLVTVGISIGGIAEIIPLVTLPAAKAESMEAVKPYTPLEVAGRDIYVREGCYNCHSQMVRPFRAEALRYGPWTRAGETVYDHPFQLGSRRIGPDIQRLGGKYPNAWHWEHMKDPRATSPGSIMPPYPWLYEYTWSGADIQASMGALATVGVPYSADDIANAPATAKAQADEIVANLATAKIEAKPEQEIIALTAYLQRLGVDGRKAIEAQSKGGGQ